MKVLIVDDEAPARDRLRRLLGNIDGIQVVGEAADGRTALLANSELQPDLLLLDIRMPALDGMATARELAKLDNPPAVIFTTAYGEHALEAFEAEALDYLVKPVRQERLEQALARVEKRGRVEKEENGKAGRSHLTVRKHGDLQLIAVNEILYLQADNKYVTAYLPGREELLEESLKQLEEEFGERFLRVHRNALITRQRLEGIEKDLEGHCHVTLRGVGRGPEISRRHLPEIRRILRERG
ncbi:MAG: LytTR family DNA-binding domain-containing protein [Gammaproteobacteria bacterium]|nr:LytTR family DNA-binding domain-containing protein [Gammaproteobacteria bacterium]MCW8839561.1 LytTR family DNA-binding domain-containing protein [Gammaproteobacteria bacterium]MCW8957494.1 LytTR family DNA-binding domain-containing protein [Gammaproteobacteria bacterium]MCW8971996.1 LytTR family DNA-binding domain-containing protein [Gammaproteobacteria bacterium]MCW8991963.1 LytTR family DNA-binding domain-containing protein [Gammaproteobacteria bacterium]